MAIDPKIAQITEEMTRDFAAELESRMFNGQQIANGLNGVCNEDTQAVGETGEMMSSIRSLVEIMQSETEHGYRMATEPIETGFSWRRGANLNVQTMYEAWQERRVKALLTDMRATIIRENAYVEPELIANAEIRALENPS